jgi:glycosyltransferase involved in cell wall biosynthesis
VGAATRVGFALQLLRVWPTQEQWIAADRLRALRTAIRSREERQPVDLVVFTTTDFAPLVPACRAPVALVALASSSQRSRHEAAAATTRPRALRWKLEASRARLWERRWLSRVKSVIVDEGQADAWLDALAAGPAGLSTEAAEPSWPAGDSLSASVVLCTRNRPDLLRRALGSISDAVAQGGAELVIVEQGDPAAEAICDELGITAAVVRDTGVGAARARNLGARRTIGDVVLFTDDDCEVPRSWVVDHVREFADAEVTASFGVVTQLSRYDDPTDGSASWRGWHRRGALPWNIGHSANMAVRRSAFTAVGGFDERLGPGAPGSFIGEDADLIVRLLDDDGLAVSGVGDPVRHVAWRSDQEVAMNVVSYERGTGAWIGKALRANRASGRRYLRDRLPFLRGLLASPGLGEPRLIVASVAAFARGLVAGVRMGPWRR